METVLKNPLKDWRVWTLIVAGLVSFLSGHHLMMAGLILILLLNPENYRSLSNSEGPPAPASAKWFFGIGILLIFAALALGGRMLANAHPELGSSVGIAVCGFSVVIIGALFVVALKSRSGKL
jgi:hypothetical protein